ncbi:hypothetical protein FRC09_003961 [Ceratobasidium sp. 395]|nr:hypothetical protein FRC09_003961 [Ceratobasidium sp. 395]
MILIKTEEPDLAHAVKIEESDPTEAPTAGPAKNAATPARIVSQEPQGPLAGTDRSSVLPGDLPVYECGRYPFEVGDVNNIALLRMFQEDVLDACQKRDARLASAREERNRTRRDGIELVRLGPGDDEAIATRTRGRKENSYPNTRARAARFHDRVERVARRGGSAKGLRSLDYSGDHYRGSKGKNTQVKEEVADAADAARKWVVYHV